MFGFYNKTSELDTLQKKYENYLKNWNAVAITSKAESKRKYKEAKKILDRMEKLLQ